MERQLRSAQERAVLLLRAVLPFPGWLPTSGSQRLVWAIRIALVVGILVLISSAYDKTLWNWLQLLIVPAVIAGVGIWFNRQQQERQLQANLEQQKRELEVADRRAQDEALQAYLDQMSQLLTDKDRPLHTTQPGNSLSTVARARTLTVLPRLAGNRKAQVVHFLYESGLIAKGRPILDLSDADLRGVNLGEANLRGANLGGANLSWALLIKALLIEADLHGADLSEALLIETDLHEANLSGAVLSGARGISKEQLEKQAKNLEGATMPDGQKYEDWLKSRGEENSGPS